MIKDKEIIFSSVNTDGTSIGDAPTAQTQNIATNIWDSGPLGLPSGSSGGTGSNAGRDLGLGTTMWFEALVLVKAASGGSATLSFEVVTDSTSTIATKNVLVASAAFTVAQLIAGFKYRVPLPAADTASATPYKRYLSCDYNIGTTTMTGGTYETKLILNLQAADLYQSGFAVS